MKHNHHWQEDKNYSGSFDEKDICVYCNCIRLLGWRRLKGSKHPLRVIKYYLNGELLIGRPNCIVKKESLPDIFSEQNDKPMQHELFR